MINAAAAEVGHGIVGVTVGDGVPPPTIDVAEGPAPEPEPAAAAAPEEPKRTRRGPLSLAQRLDEMRGMYARRIARKRAIEARLASELAELRASISEDEAELSTLSAGKADAQPDAPAASE